MIHITSEEGNKGSRLQLSQPRKKKKGKRKEELNKKYKSQT